MKNVIKDNCRKKRPRRAKFYKKDKVIPSPFVRPVKASTGRLRGSQNKPTKKYYHKSDLLEMFLPNNLRYMVYTPDSPFYHKSIKGDSDSSSENGVIKMPRIFSLVDNPEESILTIRRIINALLFENNQEVFLDYAYCAKADVGAQALMDIILMEYNKFANRCSKISRPSDLHLFPSGFGGRNINDGNLKKMMFSVGSPSCLGIKTNEYPDIIPFKMCSRCMLTANDRNHLSELKDLDTTYAVDYVVDCLAKMNKKLTPKRLNDLSIVIGEILINAEEHSTLNHRFSVGYFQDTNENGRHYGLLKLVIMNFGASIYETFKHNPTCPVETKKLMTALSETYTKRGLFKSKEFEEETLWTLYALQQGVTSVAGKRRGSGTIQFIRSFFNIKGSQEVDNISRMVLHSGRTQVIFDGTYGITEKVDGNNKFNMMTFNHSGKIEDMPDKRYVRATDLYFPGTYIAANILLNDDDIKENS